MRRVVSVVALVLVLGGCGGAALSPNLQPPATESPSVHPPTVAEPVVNPVDRTAIQRLVVPSVQEGMRELYPRALQVRPDGGAIAVWILVQAEALVAWRTGDDKAVALPVASRSIAWTLDGFYYIAQTGETESTGEIWRFRWGQQPERVVDRSELHGPPQALAWSTVTKELFFADTTGLYSVSEDGGPKKVVAGPWGTGAVWSNVFEPSGSRYVTLKDQTLLVGTLGTPEKRTLTELPVGRLSRVAWADDGSSVAVEVEESGGAGNRIAVFDLSSREQITASVTWQKGSNPVLLGDCLYLLGGEGAHPLVRVSLSGGGEQILETGNVVSLAAQPTPARLYQVQRDRQIIWRDSD